MSQILFDKKRDLYSKPHWEILERVYNSIGQVNYINWFLHREKNEKGEEEDLGVKVDLLIDNRIIFWVSSGFCKDEIYTRFSSDLKKALRDYKSPNEHQPWFKIEVRPDSPYPSIGLNKKERWIHCGD